GPRPDPGTRLLPLTRGGPCRTPRSRTPDPRPLPARRGRLRGMRRPRLAHEPPPREQPHLRCPPADLRAVPPRPGRRPRGRRPHRAGLAGVGPRRGAPSTLRLPAPATEPGDEEVVLLFHRPQVLAPQAERRLDDPPGLLSRCLHPGGGRP